MRMQVRLRFAHLPGRCGLFGFGLPSTLAMAIAALCAAIALACLPAFALQAHATFRDVADAYPAAQDLGAYGAPITGDQLPDGAYKVTARTTSRMCILYTNPADAEARDSKEQAIISVSGGSITAVFYISKAYTHLYMGPQEAAAASTNAEGTDASAYIAGDPAAGYVPHLFYLPVSALNVPITIATFSGGDKGIEEGRWYTREVVFGMADGELQAILAGEASGDGAGGGEQQEQVAEEQPALATETTNTGAGAGSGGDAVSSAEHEPAPAAEPAPTAESIGVRGVLLNGVNPEIKAVGVDALAAGAAEPNGPVITPQLMLALGLALLFACGVGWRVGRFRQSYESGGPREAGKDGR